jgi:hypothetical protein
VLKDALSMQNPNQYWSFCTWIKSNSGNVDQFHEFESYSFFSIDQLSIESLKAAEAAKHNLHIITDNLEPHTHKHRVAASLSIPIGFYLLF